MACRLTAFLLTLLIATSGAAPAQAPDTSQNARKVVYIVKPVYPELARRLQLSGVVKVWATVAANGSVKSTEPVGGHPVLIRAAQDAVADWKYAPAPGETRELIELHFTTR